MNYFFSRVKSLVKSINPFKKKIDSAQIIKERVRELEGLLGYEIGNERYFIKALTHRSYLNFFPELNKSNERLEFLGDSVLGLLVAEYLFKHYPQEEEGFLTKARTHLVNKEALADAAEKMNLSEIILYDKRYIKTSQQGIRSISADAVEAIIGAIYLEFGLVHAREFISKWIIKPNQINGTLSYDNNFKGRLIEVTHSKKLEPPVYRLVKEEGPEHDRIFTVEVTVGVEPYGEGSGKSKKSAEQAAAHKALEMLGDIQQQN